jgi:hypothetical protein
MKVEKMGYTSRCARGCESTLMTSGHELFRSRYRAPAWLATVVRCSNLILYSPSPRNKFQTNTTVVLVRTITQRKSTRVTGLVPRCSHRKILYSGRSYSLTYSTPSLIIYTPILPTALWPWVRLSLLTEMSTRNLIWCKGWPAHKAENLTAICEPII